MWCENIYPGGNEKKKKNRFRFIPNPVYRILKVFHQFIVRNYEENFVGY